MLPKPLYWTILVAICAYAMWRGRRDERIAGATCLVASVVQIFLVSPRLTRYSGVEPGVLLVDIGVLVVFVAVALRSTRFWPLWVSGLQLTTLFGHALKAVELDLLPHAYASALRFWAYPILIILAVATWRGTQPKRRELLHATP